MIAVPRLLEVCVCVVANWILAGSLQTEPVYVAKLILNLEAFAVAAAVVSVPESIAASIVGVWLAEPRIANPGTTVPDCENRIGVELVANELVGT